MANVRASPGSWTREAGKPHRSFTDADNFRWSVYELTAPVFDRRLGSVLVFESDACVRRIRVFPSDWHELPDRELDSLMRMD